MMPVLAASTAVNTTTCIAKDRAFARMFGAGPPRAVPGVAYALWLARDVITMACTFTIPLTLGLWIERKSKEGWLPGGSGAELSAGASRKLAQFAAPVLAQVPTCGLHLLGLDAYNRPAGNGVTVADRFALLRAEYLKTFAARSVRGVVPYVLGAMANSELRQAGRAAAAKASCISSLAHVNAAPLA